MLDDYIASRCDVKGTTATVYGHTRRNLIAFFGADKRIQEITYRDADKFRKWLATNKFPARKGCKATKILAKSTVDRRCSYRSPVFLGSRSAKVDCGEPIQRVEGHLGESQ